MVLMSLKTIVFGEKMCFFYFAIFLFFVDLLPGFKNERSLTIKLAAIQGRLKWIILIGKIWLYNFHSVFSQILLEFLVCCLFFFLQPHKKWIMTNLNAPL